MTTNILTAIITAYCHCKLCCGPNAKGITASGTKPIQGITVAGPRSYLFGSKVIMPSIGLHTGRIEDRTARRFDGRFDVYFRRHSEAKKFGIKTNKVIIITK